MKSPITPFVTVQIIMCSVFYAPLSFQAPEAASGSGLGDLLALGSTTTAASSNGNQLSFDPWSSTSTTSSSSNPQAPTSSNPFQTPANNPAPSSSTGTASTTNPWGVAQTTTSNGEQRPSQLLWPYTLPWPSLLAPPLFLASFKVAGHVMPIFT